MGPWTNRDTEVFEATWPTGTRERLAFDILRHTGLRRGDAIRLGTQHVAAGGFRVLAEKTGEEIAGPVSPTLAASIEASPVGLSSFIATVDGQPMSKEVFSRWFRGALQKAGVQASEFDLFKA